MVHVLSGVLRKVARLLRDGGKVLIYVPSQENPIVEILINGNIVFREETNEQNFRRYLRVNVEAIHQSVNNGVFDLLSEATIPDKESHLCYEYDSQQEWEDDRLSFCEDLDSFKEMSGRIKQIIGGRPHRVIEYWREYQVILQKR